VRFKLDENLSPTLAEQFLAAGHEAHSVLEQALGGASDPRVIEVCRTEDRALITLDLDFANIQRYPPARYSGIMVMRLGTQAHGAVAKALADARAPGSRDAPRSIVDRRIRTHPHARLIY
jgi:predicted nuclease of predicted toxin-antitoxin system